MARFNKALVLSTIKDIGLIPVFYNPDVEIAKKIVDACYKGGAKVVEMTNRGDHAIDVFCQLERYCKEKLPELIIGVGSIIDAPTVALYIAHGTNFVVGPVIDVGTAKLCNKRKIPYSPGCGSVSEIHFAHELGVDLIKIFPGAQVGGPGFVKAVKGPCPWTEIIPTGGVNTTKESLYEWFKAGVYSVGIGSKLITKEIVKNKDFKKLSSDVSKVIGTIKEIRKSITE
jgi:2-dehydro-3-deoxyphosphogluconate aldolase/(4S)-4-hydroxy-2-oxoglutarate aldolase